MHEAKAKGSTVGYVKNDWNQVCPSGSETQELILSAVNSRQGCFTPQTMDLESPKTAGRESEIATCGITLLCAKV